MFASAVTMFASAVTMFASAVAIDALATDCRPREPQREQVAAVATGQIHDEK